ncbi:MAG: hypothetical protein HKN21_10890 [Candidatus Eisenbacteria bacterium]|uniref:Neutral ceramidase n=1 Tax=Eiseniibacteriota bacterium TaxID=2212470 RepID=A0A7Y2E9W2_UNCEI|nr:hypothetical protein [Candidatus Eisenbacteria bacterium]
MKSWIWILVLTVLSGCATVSGTIPPTRNLAGSSPGPEAYWVGAAETDITPTPGFANGGHSIAGQAARGVWTRLMAKAFYVEDATGTGILILTGDLWSVPAGLGDRVAEILAEDHGVSHIGREGILLHGTHTHHGPGNFASNAFYNRTAQRWQGFDPHLFEFLAQRMARAGAEAVRQKSRANLTLHTSVTKNLFRNRSLAPFMQNPDHREFVAREMLSREVAQSKSQTSDPNHSHPNPNHPNDRLAFEAVDKRVRTLVATDRHENIVAVVNFLAVHPTVLHPQTPIYSGDLFSATSAVLAHRLVSESPSAKKPIVLMINGAEGDVSPNWVRRDRKEVVELAHRLATHIGTSMLGNSLVIQGPIRKSFERVDLKGYEFREGNRRRKTSHQPLFGSAAMGGAEDGRSVLHELGWQEGRVGKRKRKAHGPKQAALDPVFLPFEFPVDLTGMLMPAHEIPSKAPLGVYRLGTIALATLPGEFTTMMGHRIAKNLGTRLGISESQVMLLGLTNEYISYFVTPEEYALQHYEGASTIYGQASGPAVNHALEKLSMRTGHDTHPRKPHRYSFQTGGRDSFGLESLGYEPYFAEEGLSMFFGDRKEIPRFEWNDRLVAMEDVVHRGETTPRVSIEVREGNQWIPYRIDNSLEDDRGLSILTVALCAGKFCDGDTKRSSPTQSRWATFWIPPGTFPETYRFRVRTLSGRTLHSPPFVSGAVPN